MNRVLGYFGQGIFYALFALALGYFSTRPAYTHLDPGNAMIKLSFSHAGDHVEECRRLSQEELNRLAPNMRRPTQCLRARVPLRVELMLDGVLIYQEVLQPSGVANDGASTAYKKFPVTAGRHHLVIRMRNSRRESGFDHEQSADITLASQQNFVIDFRPDLGGFLFL